MTLPKCQQRGKRVSETAIECFSDHFAGPNFAHRPLTLCAKPCPFADKPQLAETHPHLFRNNEPCVHLGTETGRIDCPSCSGTVKVKTFACAVHGQCTLGKALDDVACCAGCAEYQPNPL